MFLHTRDEDTGEVSLRTAMVTWLRRTSSSCNEGIRKNSLALVGRAGDTVETSVTMGPSSLSLPDHAMDHLDRELDAILRPLGIERESVQEGNRRQHQEKVHITCLYSLTDTTLWTELQPYLDLLKRRYHSISTWHAHQVNNTDAMNDSWVADGITQDITRADIVLLGLSVDLALSLCEQGRYVYHALVERVREPQPPEIIPILLRALVWEDEYLLLRPSVPANKPIGARRDRDTAYVLVSQAVERAIEACRQRGATR